MHCPRCQHENRPPATFCEACGTPLTANASGPPAPSYSELTSALSEALEQQTATAEILRVISGSPTDLQRVLDAIANSAARLCDARDTVIWRPDGNVLRAVAAVGPLARALTSSVEGLPMSRGSMSGRAFIEQATVHVPDLASIVDDEFPDAAPAFRVGQRAGLAMPLLREGTAIGVISIGRPEPRAFTGKQAELLKTFAAQAVIAIENVRLFTELEARNRELTESLEQQTATAQLLQVISRSPTEVQPVFDAIARNALVLCSGKIGGVYRYQGGLIHLAATHGLTGDALAQLRGRYPVAPGDGTLVGRAIRDRGVVNVADVETDQRVSALVRESGRLQGVRSQLVVPMLRDGDPIGTVTVARAEAGGFSESHIALLQTFADQAVIAIENVRLFTELQDKNRALTEAHARVTESLEQQTATAEILRVISSSPTDLQPVMDAMASNAARLCGGTDAQIFRIDDELLRRVASHGPMPAWERIPIDRASVTGRAVVDRRTIHVRDIEAEPDVELSVGKSGQSQIGFRTVLATPLLRKGTALGAILIRRMEVSPFSDNQIKLLETFADQAVIAIENVRLFQDPLCQDG